MQCREGETGRLEPRRPALVAARARYVGAQGAVRFRLYLKHNRVARLEGTAVRARHRAVGESDAALGVGDPYACKTTRCSFP